MEFDEIDLAALDDPAMRDAILYELEMLHPVPPPPPRAAPRYYSRPPSLIETEALPAPGEVGSPRIVEADPPKAGRKGIHPAMLWGGILIVVLVLFELVSSTMQAPKPAQKQPVPATCVNFSVVCKPSISAKLIDQVLAHYHSPAHDKGQSLYQLGVQYGIDPVYPLAFFMNESTFGTKGMATVTLALSNERCIPDRQCVNTQGLQCQAGQSCYAQMYSWEDGFEHWYQLIRNEYITGRINQVIGRKACPCTTIQQIIPVYAPNADNNDEGHYIYVVEQAVSAWRSGKVIVP